MKHKVKRLKEGGGYGRFTEENVSVEDQKKGLFAGSPAEDDSDTYAPKTRSFSETGPDKPKAKPKPKPKTKVEAAPVKEEPQESGADKRRKLESLRKEQSYNFTSGKKGTSSDSVKSSATELGDRTDAMGNAYRKGGSVSSASSRGDGIAQRGKTRGRMC